MRTTRYLSGMIAALSVISCATVQKAGKTSDVKTYDSYRGLVMAGYQGWFNADGDGAGRGFYHYNGSDGFRPGSASVDMWPDVSEYEQTYPTSFRMPDGSPARVFSSEDSTTVMTHFRWMEEYGLDGVFMQRFIAEIKNPSSRRHFDRVLDLAMHSAVHHHRAIAVMYDLSGMRKADVRVLIEDVAGIASRHNLFKRSDNPSYLYHNGHPLIAVWGIGFNDGRDYDIDDAREIVENLKRSGFSVMLGVPTHWRTLDGDTEPNPALHEIIRSADVIMPWFVGRYDEAGYEAYLPLIKNDIEWCESNGIDYAPLIYPGFSWKNMCGEGSFFVPRNNGRFFQKQIDGALCSGAEMIYVAMFDEIDEGTAIFKCEKTVPLPQNGTEFVPVDSAIEGDHYLKAVGEASTRLKKLVDLSSSKDKCP